MSGFVMREFGCIAKLKVESEKPAEKLFTAGDTIDLEL